MAVKVSVIVSVHNPGNSADACIRSVLEQSMPAEEYEVIFVDDGSTDGVAERLDAVAAVRGNVRVLHLPHTGSPMRGRNVGLATAKGDYVYLLDQQDRLAKGAIPRMYQRALETDADVLVGRLVRDGGAPMTAFEASRERADLLRDRLLTQLTPHKLVRRTFLEQHGIGFAVPGGRLAEQSYSVRAYLAAKVVTVLAEEVCCHLGERQETEESPAVVSAELRALLAAVDELTTQGRQRDRVYAHLIRSSVLRPFLTPRFGASSMDRVEHYAVAREVVRERLPERLDRHLPVQLRVVAALVRAGRLDQLVTLANVSKRAGLRADLTEVRWDAHVLALGLSVEVLAEDGAPARYVAEGDRLLWIAPRALDEDLLPDGVTDVTAAVDRARIEVYVRHADTGVIHFLPVTFHVERVAERDHVRLLIEGEARLDVSAAAVGEPLASGQWEVHVRMYGGAHQARTRVRRPEGPLNCLGVLAQRPRRRLVVPCWSDAGELGLAIEPRSFCESIALVSPGADLRRQDGHVYVVLPVPYVPPSGGPPIELVLRNTAGRPRELVVPALVEPGLR
ncbi:MAG: glycosyltransferase family 2 protein, partial [Nonomuraea sp.]|nr:glycosyltransferase family 2 protein [Nonomuraea sp.]